MTRLLETTRRRPRPIVCVSLLAVFALGCGDTYPPERPPPANDIERAARRAEDARLSGPGYPDLEGKVFHYTYLDFAGFRVLIERNRLKFQGVSGEFEGITQLQTPQISAVGEDVYFMSWAVLGDMGDNVVVNLAEMKVFAHLGAGRDYRQIEGEIHCFGTPDECAPPEGRLQSVLESVIRVTLGNAGAESGDGDSNPEPSAAARELEGQQLTYRFPDGAPITLHVVDQTALVDEGRGPEPRGGVFTKPAESLYFISWDGEHGGEHILADVRTMEVHDHIHPDGQRRARVGRIESFGPAHPPSD